MLRLLTSLSFLILIAAEPADEAKKELDKLQGDWVMTGLEIDGKELPDEKFKETTLRIKGDQYIVATGKSKYEVTIKVDPTQKPRHMDMEFPNGTCLPKVGKAIYKREGDTLIIVRAQSTDGDRPTQFGTWPDTGVFQVTWKKKPK
jgi:uncharacterized protein (TIGR03067 family)